MITLSSLTVITGLSRTAVYHHIRNLVEEGLIERLDLRGRKPTASETVIRDRDGRKARAIANARKSAEKKTTGIIVQVKRSTRGRDAEAELQKRINAIAEAADLNDATQDLFHEHYRRSGTLRGSRVG
jgi:DNA-binding transcriptional ArsR family regulator